MHWDRKEVAELQLKFQCKKAELKWIKFKQIHVTNV